MPEGDTVWRAAAPAQGAGRHPVLTRTDFRVPQLATADLTGRHRRRTVVARQAPAHPASTTGDTLHTHLRMEGAWHVYRPGDRWAAGPRGPGRAATRTTGPRSGSPSAWSSWCAPTPRTGWSGTSGPTCSAPTGTGRSGAPARRRPARAIADALLDQRNLAGIGNLYRASSASSPATTRARRSARSHDLHRIVDRAQAHARRQHASAPSRATTGTPPRPAALGLPPRPAALPPLRHPDPRRPARSRGSGADDLLVSYLPAFTMTR